MKTSFQIFIGKRRKTRHVCLISWNTEIVRGYPVSHVHTKLPVDWKEDISPFGKVMENIILTTKINGDGNVRSLFCTTEDQFTQSFILPYLIPMLENAGANVFTPRESGIQQKQEVIVDNDGNLSGYGGQGSLYLEVKSQESTLATDKPTRDLPNRREYIKITKILSLPVQPAMPKPKRKKIKPLPSGYPIFRKQEIMLYTSLIKLCLIA